MTACYSEGHYTTQAYRDFGPHSRSNVLFWPSLVSSGPRAIGFEALWRFLSMSTSNKRKLKRLLRAYLNQAGHGYQLSGSPTQG